MDWHRKNINKIYKKYSWFFEDPYNENLVQDHYENLFYDIKSFIDQVVKDTAQECYLQCLAAECGEGECAEAIKSKFKLGE